MNLQNILSLVGIGLFIFSIVRGCGGMIAGGCVGKEISAVHNSPR